MRAHPVVLVPQDTTSLNYSAHPGTEGPGPIGTKLEGGPIGLVMHNSHAFTPQGVPLGVMSAECWARDPEEHGRQRQPDERESRKWLNAYQVLQDIAPRMPDTCLVSIGDREADLFELFTLARDPKSPRLPVRACQGRRRKVSTEAGRLPLWKHMQALPVAGHTSVDIPRRGQHKARTALLSVRFGPVRIDLPQDKVSTAGTADAPIDLWALHLLEEDPPDGVEAVEWMLLTNVPTTSLEEALERARWYASRWGIEVFLRTLKTGCQLEERQLGYAVRLENCLAIDLVVAWRIYHLTMLGRLDPQAPCTVFFRDPEWKALYSWYHDATRIPATPPTLRFCHALDRHQGRLPGPQIRRPPRRRGEWHGCRSWTWLSRCTCCTALGNAARCATSARRDTCGQCRMIPRDGGVASLCKAQLGNPSPARPVMPGGLSALAGALTALGSPKDSVPRYETALRVGACVLAIGSPFGFENSVSTAARQSGAATASITATASSRHSPTRRPRPDWRQARARGGGCGSGRG